MRRLIINADDLGIAEATNRAVERAHREGVLTSASLMVNMPAFEHAVETVVAGNSRLDVGLHLCLTSGPAVLDRRRIPLLVDEMGRFRRGFSGLCRLLLGRRRVEALRQIADELEAQFRKAEAAGIDYSHVDGHQHVQMIPAIFDITSARLSDHSDVLLRVSSEPRIPANRGSQPSPWRLTPLLSARRLLLSRLAKTCLTGGERIRRIDAVFGIADSGHVDRNVLKNFAAAAPVGVSEVIIHPSLGGNRRGDECLSHADLRFLKSTQREVEFHALIDGSVLEEIKRCGVVLTTFREIAAVPITASSGDHPSELQATPGDCVSPL